MSTAIAPVREIRSELQRYAESLTALLPPNSGYTADRLITSAMTAIQNDTSGNLAKCEPKSIALALARVAQWGLDVGVTAHLVPFGRTATPVADYKGLIELMCAAGARDVDAQVVREGDEFEYELGLTPILKHRPGAKRGKITHAYCVIRVSAYLAKFEVMSAEEIDAIRLEKSKSWKNGPLPEWYARKTVIRRASKYAPKHGANGKRLSQVLAEDELPVVPEGEASDLPPALTEGTPDGD